MPPVVPMPVLASRLTVAIRLVAAAVVLARARMDRQSAGRQHDTREQTLLLGLVLSLCASNVIWSHYLLFGPGPVAGARCPCAAARQAWTGVGAPAARLDGTGELRHARWMQEAIPTDTWWGLTASALAGIRHV